MASVRVDRKTQKVILSDVRPEDADIVASVMGAVVMEPKTLRYSVDDETSARNLARLVKSMSSLVRIVSCDDFRKSVKEFADTRMLIVVIGCEGAVVDRDVYIGSRKISSGLELESRVTQSYLFISTGGVKSIDRYEYRHNIVDELGIVVSSSMKPIKSYNAIIKNLDDIGMDYA